MGKKERKKLARRVDGAITQRGISVEDLIYAGLGSLAKAEKKGKKKVFTRLGELGQKVVAIGMPATVELIETAQPVPSESYRNPMIAYRPNGGGWYNVEVGDHVVATVQGEEEAAQRAGRLLAEFAALDLEEQEGRVTGIRDQGGGWYTVQVEGVPLDRVRGRAAAERMLEDVMTLDA